MLIRTLALAALAPLLLLAACGDDDDDAATNAPTATSAAATTAAANGGDPEPQDVAIGASGFAFDVTEITAEPGQVINITLTNGDEAPHSFTVGDEDVVEADPSSEAEGSFTASEETTEFHCKFHPSMTGTITIAEAGAANPSSTGSSGGSAGFGY